MVVNAHTALIRLLSVHLTVEFKTLGHEQNNNRVTLLLFWHQNEALIELYRPVHWKRLYNK